MTSKEEDEAWLAYFYPETVNEAGFGVFRNNLDIHNFNELQIAEYELVEDRSRQLLDGSVQIPLVQDVSYLQNVHRHLFQDVYPWAGEFRTVNIHKEGSVFANKDLLGAYLRPFMKTIVTMPWDELDHKNFVYMSAFAFAEFNHAHPFREGNGRTGKVVMDEISKRSMFEFHFDQVSAQQWNVMARATMPTPGAIMSHPEPAVDIFRQVAIPRTTPVPEHKGQAAPDISQILSARLHPDVAVDKTTGADPATPGTPAALDPSKAAAAPYRQPRRLSDITKEMKHNPAPAQQPVAEQAASLPPLQVQPQRREHEY